jgi:hypothetical protein
MKKNYLLTFAIIIVASLVLSACEMIPFLNVIQGTGNLISETRQVRDFNAIQLDGAGRLIITQGTTESLEIQAEDNIITELTSEVQDNKLILGFQESPLRKQIIPTETITYTLTVINLTEVSINGAADLDIDTLKTSSLELVINGAGQINIGQLTADNLAVKLSGTGTIAVSGQVPAQSIIIEGAGNYQAGDLETNVTDIEISGLGNGTVWATTTLDVTISGGGSLAYYGNPEVTKDISGLSRINNLGVK